MDPAAQLAHAKSDLRRIMRARRREVSPGDAVSSAARAAALLADVPEVNGAATVAGYAALQGGLDATPALEDARRRGARVVLPRVVSDAAPRLRFHRVDAGTALRAGPMGIAEPGPDAPEVAAPDIDVFIVPGLAFDAAGRRLGYGGGYYDEVLGAARRAGVRPAFFVGLAHDFQVVDAVPAGAGDALLDAVVTPTRLIRAGGAA